MNTVYENQILENKMTELLDTKLNTRAIMTIDTSLQENAGLRKVINRYTYNGSVENLEKGEKNTVKGTVSFVPEYYDVKRYQQTFEYNDMDAMADPYIVEVAMKGATTEITNQINKEYFDEVCKISQRTYFSGDAITYADIVDALTIVDVEVEDGLFIIMGAEARKQIRKDTDFVASRQGEILYTGQFGTLCGVPVLFSKLVKGNTAYITNKDAIRFFIKKEASVEQARDIETKDNTVVYERHGLIALVDDTKSIQVGKIAKEFEFEVEENYELIDNVTHAKITYTLSDENNKVYYAYNVPYAPFEFEAVPDYYTLLDTESVKQLVFGEKISLIEADKDGNCVAFGTHKFRTYM